MYKNLQATYFWDFSQKCVQWGKTIKRIVKNWG